MLIKEKVIYPKIDFRGVTFIPFQIVCGEDYSHLIFEFIGANDIEFINCNFSYSRFKDAHFRNCSFVNCNFTGSKWTDSNFTRISIKLSNLKYLEFKNVQIDGMQILDNLPIEPNLRQKLLQSLRKNLESRGDRDAIKLILEHEIQASHDYYYEALTSNDVYYSEYKMGYKRLSLKMRHITHSLLWFTWGHGEFPFKIFRTMTLLLLVSLLLQILIQLNVDKLPIDMLEFLWKQFVSIISIFLGASVENKSELTDVHIFLKFFILTIRYTTIGMFISSLTRRYSWR